MYLLHLSKPSKFSSMFITNESNKPNLSVPDNTTLSFDLLFTKQYFSYIRFQHTLGSSLI